MKEKVTNMVEIAADFADISIEKSGLLSKIEIFSDVPYFGFFIKCRKTINSYRDYTFFKKFISFLSELELTSGSNYSEFRTKYSKQFKDTNLTQVLFKVLDDSESIEKAKIVAKLFDYCAKNEYTNSVMIRVLTIIRNAYIFYFDALRKFTSEEKILINDEDLLDTFNHLYSIGLLRIPGVNLGTFESMEKGENDGTYFTLNKYGRIFQNALFNEVSD